MSGPACAKIIINGRARREAFRFIAACATFNELVAEGSVSVEDMITVQGNDGAVETACSVAADVMEAMITSYLPPE